MKQLTLLVTLLLIMTFGLVAAKKNSGNAPAKPTPSVAVSCSICVDGSPITITVTNFDANTNATMTVLGPYTAVTLIGTDNSGNFSQTYATGLHFPAGSYSVSISQAGGAFASTTFSIQ